MEESGTKPHIPFGLKHFALFSPKPSVCERVSISLSAYPCYISVYGKNVLDSEIMAKIAKNLTELIGHTPLMELAEYSRKYGLKRNIVAKLESFNPAGSVKDRVAFAMIEDAEARGALKP